MSNGKNLLAFAFALLALFAAFRYGMRAMSGARERAAPPPEPAEWASWKTETFDDLGFTLRHPADWPVIAGADSAGQDHFLAVDGSARFTVKVPKTRYKGTKFVDAFVTVAAGGDIPAADGARKQLCDLFSRDGAARPLSGRDEIGGTAFSTGGASAAVGGLREETLAFHAWFGGRCIEFTENLLSAIGGRAKDFDRVDAWKQLDGVVRTFRPLETRK